MGKHDKVIEASTEEYYTRQIRDLKARLAFVEETNDKLMKECAKWQKWMNQSDANAQDIIDALNSENAMLREKIAKLVEIYV